MCLQALGFKVTEDEVNEVMGARAMRGASWEQAMAAAQHYGCRASLSMPATVEQLKAWTDRGVPVMIAWNPEGRPWSHASVVFDVDTDGNVHVADPNIPDPSETVRVVPRKDFYGKWSEKWDSYLVRRPACAIEREVTETGTQIPPKMFDDPEGPIPLHASVRTAALKLAGRRQETSMTHERTALDELERLAGYKGNPDGADIYPNEIEHGYGEPVAGGTDVMRKLQNQLLHEQGNTSWRRPDSPKHAARDLRRSSFDKARRAEDNMNALQDLVRLACATACSGACGGTCQHHQAASKPDALAQLEKLACGEPMDEQFAKFEEGEDADPTKHMSPEDKAKWDQFHGKAQHLARGGDPRWIRARRPGTDAKGRPFKAGEEILWFPNTKTILTGKEAQQAWRDFQAQVADEAAYRSAADGAKADYEPGEVESTPTTGPGAPDGEGSEVPDGEGSQEKRAGDFEADYFGGRTAYSGLYGLPRTIQADCERASRQITKAAMRIAKDTYRRHARTAEFLSTHSQRASSLPAKILVAAMQELGPKIASDPEAQTRLQALRDKQAGEDQTKEAGRQYGLYGFPAKVSKLGLGACTDLQFEAGRVASDLHRRKADKHARISEFLGRHAKEAGCLKSQLLFDAYPGADLRLAAMTPEGVDDWLTWDD